MSFYMSGNKLIWDSSLIIFFHMIIISGTFIMVGRQFDSNCIEYTYIFMCGGGSILIVFLISGLKFVCND